MNLGIKPRNVYFRSLWYQNGDSPSLQVRGVFQKSNNWPLRGLYWLSKDLFDGSLAEIMEPDARELYVIRNRLEHSYLKVHEMIIAPSKSSNRNDFWTDSLAYSITREELNARTLRVFKLARAGLIYLLLGMHSEERRRAKGKDESKVMPMVLSLWDDSWKQ